MYLPICRQKSVSAMRFIVVAFLLAFSPNVTAADSGVRDIDAAAVAGVRADGATVIDIRRSDEWRATGVIPDSRLLTAFDSAGRFQTEFLEALLIETDPDDPIVLVCRSGARSAAVGRFLVERQGYSNVFNVEGGMIDWLRRDYAVDACHDC